MKQFSKNSLATTLAALLIGWCPVQQFAQTNDQVQVEASVTNILATATNAAATDQESNPPHSKSHPPRHRGPVFSLGGSVSTASGELAESVVAVGGSAKAGGEVQNAVVAIGGNAAADAAVGDGVVAVGGDATARGKVGDAVVAVAGNARAEGAVGDAVVAVMGDVQLGSNAVVHGDVVSVGGKVEMEEGAEVKGQVIEVSIAKYPILAPLKGAADWLRHCALKFRLLAPQPGWYWFFAVGFLLLYLLIAAALPRPVAACVKELTERPATTFLLGLLMKLLLPLVFVLLAITGIGVVVIPFLLVAAFIGAIIGKTALFEFLGGNILRLFGVAAPRPILALFAGFVLITLVYMVPFLSLFIYTLLGLWALGVAVTAAFSGARRESRPRPPVPPQMPAPGVAGPGTAPPPPGNFTTPDSGAAFATPGMSTGLAPAPEAYTLPRAGFWERMGAAFLDIILVGIFVGFVAHSPPFRFIGPPIVLAVALAYFAGMWAWKGTTVGGIVLNLKVVRLDGQPVSFAVALVRGLASTLSIFVFFLGFLWVILDREKQSWHDKIAGTVVVRTPRGIPLV